MERDVAIALALSTTVLTLIGGLYLAPGKPAAPGEQIAERVTFSPDDVRYKYQVEAQKAAKRNKGKKPSPPVEDAQPMPEPSENEAPPVDESADESAEAPPIE